MKVGELIAVLSVDMAQYDKDLATAQAKAKTVGSTISDIFKNAVSFTLGMGLFNAIQSGFRAVVSSALDFNVMMQNATIGFTTMLGSAQKAQDFLDQMGKFAAATPFEYPDLLEASRRLMAFGYAANDVLPIIKSVGDSVAALGGGRDEINSIIYALGQMRTAGRLNAQDMMQLTNAGIPAWEILAEKMGKSVAEVRKLSEEGLIPAAQAVNILIEGMEKRFPNMMEKMQDTWQGVTSTIKDVWRMTIGAVTQSLFQGLNNWLKGVRDWATQFYAAFQQGGLMFAIQKMLGPDVAAIINVVASTLRTLWNVLVGIANFVRTHWATLKPILIGVLSTLLYFKSAAILQSVFKNVAKELETLRYNLTLFRMGLRDIPGLIGKISTAIKMLTATNPVFLIITAVIAGVIVAGVLLYKNWDKVRYYGLQAWGALKIGIAYVAYAIVSYYKIILGWIPALGNAFGNMQKSLANYIANEKSILAQRASDKDDNDVKSAQKLVDNQKKIADASKNAASGLNEQADATKKAGKATQGNLQSFDEIHQIMQETADASENMPDVALPNVEMPNTNVGADAALGGLSDFGDIGSAISGKIEEFKNKLAGFWDGIVEKWELVKDKFKGFADALHNLWNGIQEKWDAFKNFVRDLWNGIIEKWNGFKQSVITNFRDWLQGLWNGIQEKWEGFRNFVRDMWNGIIEKWNGFKQAIDTFKNWIVGLWNGAIEKWNKFRDLITKLWDGVVDKWNGVKQGITTFVQWVGGLWDEVKKKWEEFKQTILSIWDNIKKGALDKWEAFKNEVSSKIKAVKDFVIDKIWGPVVKWFDTNIWDPIRNNAQKAWDIIKKEWEEVIKKVKKAVIDDIWNPLVKWFENLWGKVKNATIEKWEKLFKPDFEKVVKAAKDAGMKIWNGITQDVPNIVKNAVKAVSDIKNEIVKKLQEPFETAWKSISSLPSKALDWGKNLLNNIVEGINSAIGNVKNAAKNAADKIADFLGFHSPAREGPGADADKWMPNMMDMLVQGIYGNISKVRNAVAEAAGVLSGITAQPELVFGVNGSVTGYKAATQAYTAPGSQPQIHLHVGTLIADDYGLKQLEQKLRDIRIYEDQRLGADNK